MTMMKMNGSALIEQTQDICIITGEWSALHLLKTVKIIIDIHKNHKHLLSKSFLLSSLHELKVKCLKSDRTRNKIFFPGCYRIENSIWSNVEVFRTACNTIAVF